MGKMLDPEWRLIRQAAEKIFSERLRALGVDHSVTEGGWLAKRAEDDYGDADGPSSYEPDDLETYNQNEADDYRDEQAPDDPGFEMALSNLIENAVAGTLYQELVYECIREYGVEETATGLYWYCADYGPTAGSPELNSILGKLAASYTPAYSQTTPDTPQYAVYETLLRRGPQRGEEDQSSDDPTENS